jgi:Phage Tail Collar Domain
MRVIGHTRRRFLELSAGAVGGLLGASAVLLNPVQRATAQPDFADVVVGELRVFAGDFVPVGWLPCAGEQIDTSKHRALAQAMGKTFGGEGKDRARVPDLRGRACRQWRTARGGRLAGSDRTDVHSRSARLTRIDRAWRSRT